MALPDRTTANTAVEHVADHNVLHDWTQFDRNARYVATAALGGSDSNDGLTPFQPKATIQGAYDSHPGSNQTIDVFIAPGRYDQGANGLQLYRNRPARFHGIIGTHTGVGTNTIAAGNTVLYTSSATATSLVNFPNPGTAVNGYGFMFERLGFEIGGAALLYGINGTNVGQSVVQNCVFDMYDRVGAWGIYTTHDDTLAFDHSWWRIDNNYAKYGGLFKSAGSAQGNQQIITRNECYGSSGGGATPRSTNPAISLEGGQRMYIAGNNWENYVGSGVLGAVYVLNSYESTFIGDAGELPVPGGSAPAGPFYWYVFDGSGCHGNFIQLNGTSSPDSTDILVNFKNGATFNTVIAPSLNSSDYSGTVTNRVKDDTTNKENWILGAGVGTSAYWWTPHFKRVAGTPESAVRGYIGDIAVRSDGGANTTLYVKESGNGTNTGWVAK